MHKISFILGEDKHVKLLVKSPHNEPFPIQKAEYVLRKCGTVEASGECVVDEHLLDMKLAPKGRGHYKLEVTYYVADSIRKALLDVEVI